jgi:hypothetical protein
MVQTNCNWRNMMSITSIIRMTLSKAYFRDFPSRDLPLLTVVCYLRTERHPEHDLRIHHFHTSDSGGNFFKKSEIYFYITL